jgi:fructokinase
VILVVGEILFDIFPDYRRLGGAPFNFAYHLKHFGFDVRFISRIGIDDTGKEILHKLELARFNLDDIQVDDDHPTGTVHVQLDNSGAPHFDIVPDVAYDYIEFIPAEHAALRETAKLIYFGTLVQRTQRGRQNLQAFLGAKASGTLNFCDINLRPDCYSKAIIEQSLSKADVLKLNTGELEKLKQMFSLPEGADALVQDLMQTYSISTLSLTKGESGSELFAHNDRFSSEPAEAITVVDSVGAGDAYAAMLAAGLLAKWQPHEILARASLFASRICEIKGAIPDSASFYQPFKALFQKK